MRMRRWLPLVAAAALAAGCSSWTDAPVPPPRADAAAYMAQHPEPERAGWVNAMILPGGFADVEFIGAAARQACPSMTRDGDGSNPQTEALTFGDLPGCGAWTATALTDDGHVVALDCGSIPDRRQCPLFWDPDGYIPSGGDYVRIRPGGGQVTGWGSIQVIGEFADLSPALDTPDPGGPVFASTAAAP